MMKCQFCGSDNESWYVFCQNCGKKLTPSEKQSAPQVKVPSTPAPTPRREASPRETDPEIPLDDPLIGQPTVAIGEEGPVGGVTTPGGDPPQEAALREGSVKCPQCRREVLDEYIYCGYCGDRLDGAAATEEMASRQSPATEVARLLRIREDGAVESGYGVREGEFVMGREEGDLTFPADNLLSKKHARISASAKELLLEDLDSTNGTFLRLRKRTELRGGDYLLIGKQLLRFEKETAGSDAAGPQAADQTLMLGSVVGKYEAKLVKRLPSGKDSNEYPLTETVTVLGRDKGELNFKNDPFVSSKHAKIELREGKYFIEDLDSSNGTYWRLRQRVALVSGDFFIVGEQLFQVR